MEVKLILNIISHTSIWLIDGIETRITSVNLSRRGSNGNEKVTVHSPELKNMNLTTKRYLVGRSGSSSSSSSCRAARTDIPDPLSTLFPIVHRLWQVFRATSRSLTQLLYVCSSWSSCFSSAICGVHWSTSLMSSSLLLQQCPVCLLRLTWIVYVMGGRWPYSWCLVGCCRPDLFNIARNILV